SMGQSAADRSRMLPPRSRFASASRRAGRSIDAAPRAAVVRRRSRRVSMIQGPPCVTVQPRAVPASRIGGPRLKRNGVNLRHEARWRRRMALWHSLQHRIHAMTRDELMRRVLWASVFFNLLGAVLFLFPASIGRLAGLPAPV